MIEIRLVQLSCITATEADGDEIYFLAIVDAPSYKRPVQERTPKGMDIIPMNNGAVVNNYEANLFYGETEDKMRISAVLMEMDMVNLVNDSISIIGKWIDDTLGAVLITVSGESYQVSEGKNVAISTVAENHYKAVFTGGKGKYEAVFEVVIK